MADSKQDKERKPWAIEPLGIEFKRFYSDTYEIFAATRMVALEGGGTNRTVYTIELHDGWEANVKINGNDILCITAPGRASVRKAAFAALRDHLRTTSRRTWQKWNAARKAAPAAGAAQEAAE